MAFGAILAGVSLVSSVLGFSEQRKASKASRSAEGLAASRQAVINVQNRRAAAAAIRRQQAQQKAASIATGQGGGSADRATRSSVAAQGIASLATQAHQIELGADINEQIANANRHTDRAGNYAAVGALASQVSGLAGQLGGSTTGATVPGLSGAPTLPVAP